MVTTITLPWPDKRLTPNAKRRKHWSAYRGAAAADRTHGFAMSCACLTRAERKALASGGDAIGLTITFYPPDRRHRDDDGMIGAFKHMRDGIADALCVDDRRFRPQYHFAEPEKPGRVEVSFG